MPSVYVRDLGEITYKEEEVVTFERGLPGFDQLRRFIWVQLESGFPLWFMQSLDDEDICFIVTDPFMYYPDYEFHLDDAVVELLNIEDYEDIRIYSIVTMQRNIQEATLNLLAPVIVNEKLRKARQVLLHGSVYRTKHPLFPESPVTASDGKG